MVGTPPTPGDPTDPLPTTPTPGIPAPAIDVVDGPDRGRFAGTPGAVLGPLDTAPADLTPPYTSQPPRWQHRDPRDRDEVLHEALHGVQLGAYDRQVIGWLAGWDVPTVATVASLVRRARRAALAGAPGTGATASGGVR